MQTSDRKLPAERVGQISFLLARLIAEELKNETRDIDGCANTLQIPRDDLEDYLRTIDGEVHPEILFHGTPCPLCVCGVIKYEDKVLRGAVWVTLLKCSSCRTDFERTST